MYAKLTCSPPLGQTTTISPQNPSVKFTVLIESSTKHDWEVALWSNYEHHEKWTSLSLSPLQTPPSLTAIKGMTNADSHRQWYSLELKEPPKHSSSISFTITFRASKDESWKWANEHFSTSDGHIVYQSSEKPKEDLPHYIEGLPPSIIINKESSDTPDTLVWSATSPTQAALGKTSGYTKTVLGKPKHFSRWYAVVRLWSPWISPRQGKDTFAPDKEGILAAFQRDDGTHLVVLAISGVDDVLTTLYHDDSGNVRIDSRNDSEEDGVARLAITVGKSLETAVAAAMYYARRLVLKYEVASGEAAAEEKALMDGYQPEWLQNWYDGLAYCTWNGLGQNLHEDKIFKALDSLQENDINIQNLIIDDNWQSLSKEGGDQFENAWMEFEATKTGFPRGLKAAVTDIRNKHKNIKHVAVWHALFGYWGGIAASGKIAKEYKTTVVCKRDGVSGGKMLAIAEEDVDRFYGDFYQFLNSAGVDSVKTDAQFFIDELDCADDRRKLTKAYQDAWSISHLRYFSARAISCMSQVPQIMFHSQLPSNKPRILLRNSDDFFPEVPASHPWHIFCNAHNSIFTQYLNILPDWDMFQTSHEWASFHAAARCVSGGPIYITDIPGQHDAKLISQMTGNTPRGDTVILRTHTVGKSSNAYNAYDDPVLLKVNTYVGRARTGVSILGVFNCTQNPVSELIGLDQFPGAETGTYIIRNFTTGQVTKPTSVETGDAYVQMELPIRGWEILSAYPLHSFELKHRSNAKGPSNVSIAVLGMVDKMTGAAAIVNSDSYVDQDTGRLRIWTSMKVLGTYGLYISNLKQRSIEDDFMAVIFGRPFSQHCLKISDECENVLEFDLARAWKETDSTAGWSNEVAIEVLIR